MPETKDGKYTEEEFYDLIDGFAMDFEALFRIYQDEVLAILDKGVKQGWTPEKIVEEIEKIF